MVENNLMEIINIQDIKFNDSNPRTITQTQLDKLKKSVQEFPQMLELRPLVIDEDNVVLGGNMRLKALMELGIDKVPVKKIIGFTQEQKQEFIIKDNIGYGEWEWETLLQDWDNDLLLDWGLEIPDYVMDDVEDEVVVSHKKLQETFIVPPFSILDSRQGYWMERKKSWKNLIGDEGDSREYALDEAIMANINQGVSILDPVLSELIVRWFGLPQSKMFDCFAGDSVFGYVASYLGNSFTGVELREEQVKLNNSRVTGFNSKYICDDGQNVCNHIQKNSQDLLFSCPPYFDLEVYSDLPNDASNQQSYEDFIKILDNAFTGAISCLKDDRFAAIVVGDIRRQDGFYYDFITDIKNIFIKNGMGLYNEMVLVEPIGTLPQRVGRYMTNRKIGKCHQNVLVFYKGDTSKIKNNFPKLDIDATTNV